MVSSTTLSEADARLHEQLASAMAAAAPNFRDYISGLIPPDKSFTACSAAGTARHEVTVSRAAFGTPDIGPAVLAALEAKGWKFGRWQSEAKPHPNYIYYTFGTQGGYRMKIQYRKGMGSTDLIAGTPCLPGSPTTEPSVFPLTSASHG